MNWTTHDKEPEQRREIADDLPLGDRASVSINYSPYRNCCLYISLPYEQEKHFDAADRDGTRAFCLRELLPLAESALVALRQAVAELPVVCDAVMGAALNDEQNIGRAVRDNTLEHDLRLIGGQS